MKDLRNLMSKYRKRVDLAVIPHCKRVQNLIESEISKLN